MHQITYFRSILVIAKHTVSSLVRTCEIFCSALEFMERGLVGKSNVYKKYLIKNNWKMFNLGRVVDNSEWD